MITHLGVLWALALAVQSGSTLGQNLPTERPAGCDGSSCDGCTPFQPPVGNSRDYPCGINDIYFPVPIYVIRNDTSAGQELESRQWACFACCTLGCGFDDPQNTCAYTNYAWKEGNKYGCTKCGGKDVSVKGGEVKTSFADFSTESIYTTMITPYGACAPEDSVSPSPKPSPTPSPSPATSPTPAPPVVVPSPSPAVTASPPPVVVPTPPSPTVAAAPVPGETVAVDAATPSPSEAAPAEPPTFVPIEIGSTTGPAVSGSTTTVAVSGAALVLALASPALILL